METSTSFHISAPLQWKRTLKIDILLISQVLSSTTDKYNWKEAYVKPIIELGPLNILSTGIYRYLMNPRLIRIFLYQINL